MLCIQKIGGGIAVFVLLISVSFSAVGERTLINPYEGIDWGTITHYKANLHTHTNMPPSDGILPPDEVIDLYHDRGYSVLAITDHRRVTYPWQDWSRDPSALGMLDIPGCEYSNHNHLNGFFISYTTNPTSEEESLTEIAAQGGIAHINHPGNYWNPDQTGNVPDADIQKYVKWFTDFPETLVGMEVVNKTHLHPEDEILWDALLSIMMPERPVWGFSNDDMHTPNIGPVRLIEVSWEVFLTDNLDGTSVRGAMENGRFYFSTCGTQPDPTLWDVNQVPAVTGIVHDESAGTISASAVSGGQPLPESDYHWISGGKEVHVGSVLDYKTTAGIQNYVRVQMEGQGGTTFVNPFGILSEYGTLTVYIDPADAIYSGARWKIQGTNTWYVHGDEVQLEPGTYTLAFRRADSYQTPAPVTVTVTANKTTLVTSADGAEYIYDPSLKLPVSGLATLSVLVLALLVTGFYHLGNARKANQL